MKRHLMNLLGFWVLVFVAVCWIGVQPLIIDDIHQGLF